MTPTSKVIQIIEYHSLDDKKAFGHTIFKEELKPGETSLSVAMATNLWSVSVGGTKKLLMTRNNSNKRIRSFSSSTMDTGWP